MHADAGERPNARFLTLFLSGLEAGMLGAIWMLVWMGMSSLWLRRSFWSAENLMATAFHRDAPLSGPGSTFPGLALYLLIYSLLGAVFAVVVRNRLPRVRVVLLGVLFGLAWYWVTFRWMWKSVLPVVALLHVEQSTQLGHLLYGTVLGRFPVYLARLEPGMERVVEPGAIEPASRTETVVEPAAEEVAPQPSEAEPEPPPSSES
jgi:hypothetical protein